MSVVMVLTMTMGMSNSAHAAKWYPASIEDTQVIGNVLIAQFSDAVQPAVDLDKYYGEDGLIYTASGYHLQDGDTVEFKDNTVVITFKEEHSWAEDDYIIFAKGSLKDEAYSTTNTLMEQRWRITSGPKIRSLEASQMNFSATGGDRDVTVTVKGENLDKMTNIKAVLRSTTNDASDVKITPSYGKNPTLKFTMPENTTEKSITYSFSIESYSNGKYTVPGQGHTVYFTVLPKSQTADAPVVSDITIDGTKNLEVTPNPNDMSQKFTLRITGANLDPSRVEVRAIDENGIVWPTYHYSACNGTVRFASTYNGNGATGGGNIVTVELMVPRGIGVEHTYTIQVSVTGKGGYDLLEFPQNPYENAPADTFLSEPTMTVKVKAAGLDGCSLKDTDNIKTVTVKYVNEKGREIAKPETYRGYGVTMLNQFGIEAKEVYGYELISAPDEELLKGSVFTGMIKDIADDNYTLTYKYRDLYPENPEEPEVKDTVKLAKATVSKSVYDYTGKTITPKITVTDSNKKTVKASLYKVSGAASSVGKHTLTITAKDGAEGTVKVTYTIRPSKVSGLKATAGKKKAVVSWKSHKAQTTGFKVQYSTSKSFKGAKNVTVKSASAKKVTVKSLKSNKKYYVRIMSYKKVGKTTYYSAWSSAKSVKVK